MKTIRALIFLLPVSLIFGQTLAERLASAPPDVDQALRARITKYYQAFVDGKFRAADEIVADESQDAFFAMEKDQYKGFQILHITYSDNFTKAEAVVSCKTEWAFQGRRMPVTAPFTSHWELKKDGQWYWYLQHREVTPTPFGNMKAGPNGGPTGSGFPIPPDPKRVAAAILQQVKLDKGEVAVDNSKESRTAVKVLNEAPGAIELNVSGTVPQGLSLSFEKAKLAAKEGTTLWVAYQPPENGPAPVGPANVTVVVSPIGTSLPLRIDFAPPAQAAR